MPFDGAAFVLEPSSGSPSTMPPQTWYNRWAAALRQKLTTLFAPPPLSPEMTAAVIRLLADAQVDRIPGRVEPTRIRDIFPAALRDRRTLSGGAAAL